MSGRPAQPASLPTPGTEFNFRKVHFRTNCPRIHQCWDLDTVASWRRGELFGKMKLFILNIIIKRTNFAALYVEFSYIHLLKLVYSIGIANMRFHIYEEFWRMKLKSAGAVDRILKAGSQSARVTSTRRASTSTATSSADADSLHLRRGGARPL